MAQSRGARWLLGLLGLIATAAVARQQLPHPGLRAAAAAAPAASDTVAARGVDVVTLRFDGLSVALVDVVPAVRKRLACRVVAPDGKSINAVRIGTRCRMQWLVPRTGAYRIEIRNPGTSVVPYDVVRN